MKMHFAILFITLFVFVILVEPDGALSNFEIEDFLAILEFMDMVDI
jgi:hypothetical protein